ncbi:hypothetical protein [Paenibacillus harenae]|uniref:Methylamine dehydrogenase accessory protein MauD n=1 Tax=Paenibacillus harenae TaxID=306543 RepID=A0ABT9UBB4_PAEHA|nr:hypothetical protein [Paenibacillus harenae]MDQ0115494.1 methylamine dehydrogenase accessory protein MauD [Paenibacillus harenae]
MKFIADIVLWGLVITVAVSVLRLRNKVYMPHEFKELIHAESGAPLNKEFPVQQFETIEGKQTTVRDLSRKKTILLITSPSCSVCKSVYPLINPFMEEYGDQYQIISLMLGELQEIEQVIGTYNLTNPIVRLTPEDLIAIQTNRFPFGYLLTPEGIIISKGSIQSMEHLNLLRTWTPKQPKKNRFSFYREPQTNQGDQRTMSV